MGAFSGLVVSIAGDVPSPWSKDGLIETIKDCGGTFQRSPENVHVLIIGDDPGDRPMRAQATNPEVRQIYIDTFYSLVRRYDKPIIANPRIFPGQEDRERQTTYGSF